MITELPTREPHTTKVMRIALAGNPNSGKTSVFNALTHSRYKVANYPGVTVEKKEARLELEDGQTAIVSDLPGTYSLCSTSLDEAVATQVLLGQLKGELAPDMLICVIDASNLERNLYLATQLIDLGIPLILALNMQDLAEKKGISIKREILSRLLDVPVVSLVASKQRGIEELRLTISKLLDAPRASNQRFAWAASNPGYLAQASALGTLEGAVSKFSESAKTIVGISLISSSSQSKSKQVQKEVEKVQAALNNEGLDASSLEASARYTWIQKLMEQSVSLIQAQKGSLWEKLSTLSTHKIWGVVFFLGLMGLVFQCIFSWAALPMEIIDSLFAQLSGVLGSFLSDGPLKSLLTDGIIPGVGSVLIFIPQIAILFFFLGILEDSGYLARAAFLMDTVMRYFGLQGRSFIPLLSCFACAIPGIMSTRTIPSFSDRLTTILVAPLMSCSARLPVYTLLIAAFVPANYIWGFISLQGLVLFSMYLLGALAAIVVAKILKSTLLKGEPAIFVMEMPPLRRPSLRFVLRAVWDRVLLFIKGAGTVILACSIVLWAFASFPGNGINESFAGQLGRFIEPVISPLGFNWEIGVGILASFAAREVFVSALATVYNLADTSSTSQSLISLLQQQKASGHFSLATALSLMVFYVFACQCMSTLAVTRRETGSWYWTAFMFTYMTGLAYVAALVTYRLAVWGGL